MSVFLPENNYIKDNLLKPTLPTHALGVKLHYDHQLERRLTPFITPAQSAIGGHTNTHELSVQIGSRTHPHTHTHAFSNPNISSEVRRSEMLSSPQK